MVSFKHIQIIQENLESARERFLELHVIKEKTRIERDAYIQRFEFTFELYRKTLKKILVYEGIDVHEGWPRTILKHGEKASYITHLEAMIDLLDMRNISSHEYNEMKIISMVDEIEELGNMFLDHIDICLSYRDSDDSAT